MFLSRLLRQLIEPLGKFVVHLDGRLSHIAQRIRRAVLGRHLQLPAHMMLHQLFEKALVFIANEVIIADAAADEHLFHTRQCAQPAQDAQIFPVVHDDLAAGLRRQAVLAARAHPVFHLLFAAGQAEVCSGAAHVMNVPLETRRMRHGLGLAHHAVRAARGDPAPLMELDGAEITAAEAAAVMDDGKFHLFNGRHAAQRFVGGMIAPRKGKRIHGVQLPPGERRRRDVLHQIPLRLFLHHGLARDNVLVVHLDAAGSGICRLVRAHFGKRGALHIRRGQTGEIRQITGPRNAGDLLHRLPGRQSPCNLRRLAFPHAEGNDIRPAALDDAGQHIIQPIVVVGKAAKRRLQPSQNDRKIRVSLLCQLRVNGGAAVRPLACGVYSSRARRIFATE